MWEDPIVREVRAVREAHAAQFDYDLQAIYVALKQEEARSTRTYVTLPPRRTTESAEAAHDSESR
jgi:hypothetical protein